MEKQLYKIILFAYLLFGLSSCEDVVNLDLNSVEPLLVIDATISTNEGCRVILSQTQDFDSTEPWNKLDGATITLTDNETGESDLLVFDSQFKFYYFPKPIFEGHEYNISVEYENKTYSASETIPQTVPIDSLYIMRVRMDSKEDSPWMNPVIKFSDPAGKRNYYMATIYVNGNRMKSVYIFDDEYKDGKIYEPVLTFDSNDNNDDELKIGDEVQVEMESLSYGSYRYYQTMFAVAAGGGVNPISNFSGGVLGCFKAYGKSEKTIIIAEENIVDR